jgi:hypothetical protein
MFSNKKQIFNIKKLALLSMLVVVVVAGYFVYIEVRKFINKRNNVVLILNKNTDIYNSSTEPAKELLTNLKSLLDLNNMDDEKVQLNITKLDQEIPKISILSQEISKSARTLEKDSLSDSQFIYTLFNESLAIKKATLDIVDSFVKYEVCLVKNSLTQYQNIKQFSDQITKFSNADEKITLQEKAAMVEVANKKIGDNIQLANTVSTCFDNQYTKFLSLEMKEDLAKDADLYGKYAEATKSISEGLFKNNSQLLQSGTSQLLELKDKNPAFFNSESFKRAMREPKKTLQDQAIILENQEKKVKDQIQSLKSKYLLD